MKRKFESPELDDESISGPRIREIKIPKGVSTELIKAQEKKVLPHPPELFPLHNTQVFVGRCNSGKTNAAIREAAAYQAYGSYNRIFFVSPTADENKALDILHLPKKDIYSHDRLGRNPGSAIDAILVEIHKDSLAYQLNEEYKPIYRKWLKLQKLEWYDTHTLLEPKEMGILKLHQFRPPGNIPFPSPLIILDDLSHSNIYSKSQSNDFINTLLRHRHVWGTGVSIWMLVQTFKTGVPKALRQNIRQFFIWETHDKQNLKSIYEEIAVCSKETFLDAYKLAIKEPHDFLTVDVMNNDRRLMFRHNFDRYLVMKDTTKDIDF